MNSLTLILLLFVAYFFWSSGATFLALLTLAVAFIVAIGSPQKPAAPPAAYPGAAPGSPVPIVVQAGGGQTFPRKFEFRPNFPGDPDGDEWISGKLGQWIVLFVRAFAKLFSLGKPKAEGAEGGGR